jgi:hypothetical protein
MRRTMSLIAAAVLVSAAASTAAHAQPSTSRASCDRACLIRLVDAYLAALVARDPATAPIAPNARFVENAVATHVGDGLWLTASAEPSTFKIYVPDPVSQQVGFLGVMQESGAPIEIALRLAVENGKIVEIEHLIARNLGERNLANLQTPRPGLLARVPAAERMPRERLLEIGASYYDAVDDNDGSLTPFADDCLRRENGLQTTSNPPPAEPGFGTFGAMGCAAQLDTQVMSYIDTIDNRRVEIADVDTGLVFGLSHFRHSMADKTLEIVGVPGIETWDMAFEAFDLPAAHVYKVTGGQIHEIEAMGFRANYDSPTGWE